MSKPPQGPPPDHTASDVLAPQFWTGARAPRPAPGLDVACTKIAVDFQNIRRDEADRVIQQDLEVLREATSADGSFCAFYDARAAHIETVMVAGGPFAQVQTSSLRGVPLDRLPYIAGRADHLRLSEFRDTARPKPEQRIDAGLLHELSVGAALVVSFRIRGRPAGILGLVYALPRGSFDVNLQLLLKLLGSSLAVGLERARLTLALEQMEARARLSEEIANDGLWDFDAEQQATYFSPRWRRMLGYDTVEMKRNFDWRSLIHTEDAQRVQNAVREHVAGRTPLFESVHRMHHRNGEWRWVVSRAKATLDEHGRLLRLVGVEFDITERKIYEEALFREKESAQITLQSIGDGVITTDANSVIDYINPVAEQLTGWRLEDAMGKPVEEVFRAFHEETCEPLENPLSVSIRRSRPIKSVRPMLLIRRDGNELYVESTASPIRDGSGAVSGGVLVFHDVSEARELNRRLSYHASHDVLTGLVNGKKTLAISFRGTDQVADPMNFFDFSTYYALFKPLTEGIKDYLETTPIDQVLDSADASAVATPGVPDLDDLPRSQIGRGGRWFGACQRSGIRV